MAVAKFISEAWSARLKKNLRKTLVFGRLCNRNWEGEIAQYGDTVHINNLADITVRPYIPGSGTLLVMNHGAYYNFYLNDVDAAQARPDLMDIAMRNTVIRLGEDTEQYIIGVIREGAGTKESGPIPAGGAYELMMRIKTAMDKLNVPRMGRKMVIPPTVEAELLPDNRFATDSGAAGFDIYISNNLSNEMVALTEEGVTFAQQITRMEAYQREKGLDDGVKGLSLCGAKVVVPEFLYHYSITAA